MLQQTQVDTVIPYYNRWLKKFPNVNSLAKADENDVLKSWEGLGYYTRARNLHRAAKEIVSKHGGKLPQTKEDVLALPGIGRYTAGAVLSIAFSQPVPLVDGNVIRVFTRLFNIHSEISSQSTQKNLWDIAAVLVPEKNPGDFNQALMELGAMICTPSSPSCLICPLSGECLGFKKSDPEKLPVKKEKAEIQRFEGWIFLIEKNGKFLIQKRAAGQVMGGLWEFPSFMSLDTDIFPKKEIVGKVKAAFTKYRGEYRVARVKHKPGVINKKGIEEFSWAEPKDFSKFTLSAPARKALQLAFQKGPSPRLKKFQLQPA